MTGGSYNINSGYGQLVQSVPFSPSGQVFVVGDSTVAGVDIIKQRIRPNAGKTRYYATVDAAINQVVANRGDVIFIAPGHAETISGASGITSDVAGVTIIGLGEGADRPTFTFSATASTWVVSAASTVIKNIIITPSIDAVVSAFVVSAADCELDIESRDASTTVEFTNMVLTTAAADNLKVKLKHQGFTGGSGNTNAIRLVGGTNTRIDIDYYGQATTAIVEFHTTAVVDCNVSGYMYNTGITDFTKSVVDTVTGSTWFASFNDGAAGLSASGGSGAALASDDVSGVSAQVTALQADVGDPSARTNLQNLEDMLGNPDASGASITAIAGGGYPAANALLGQRVQRTAGDIVDGTTTSVFTVTGKVLITHLQGEISGAALDAGASNLKLTANPTTGTTTDLCANLDVDADEVGTMYAIAGPAATALQRGESGSVPGMNVKGVVVNAGVIETVSSADSGTGGGLLGLDLWYVPLSDTGAVVAA